MENWSAKSLACVREENVLKYRTKGNKESLFINLKKSWNIKSNEKQKVNIYFFLIFDVAFESISILFTKNVSYGRTSCSIYIYIYILIDSWLQWSIKGFENQ